MRFGNVLGSNGSVVPRFLQQIDAGGPVTVTHPEMRRFFMSISEAVQLVLHAAALGEPGALYALDMGEQVRLVDLARNLIRLSGRIPGEDVPITFVGLRPGEKLSEELVGTDERVADSGIEKILRVTALDLPDHARLMRHVHALERRARNGDARGALDLLSEIVPGFGVMPTPASPDVPAGSTAAVLAVHVEAPGPTRPAVDAAAAPAVAAAKGGARP